MGTLPFSTYTKLPRLIQSLEIAKKQCKHSREEMDTLPAGMVMRKYSTYKFNPTPGQELCLQYRWAKNSVFSTPGPRTLSSVPLAQELCLQYPSAKNSVISTPGPKTLSSVPLGQELCHQYPWARNCV